ncbi:tyrosine-type recombinase/integrase [Nocardia sp. NEAU-G5]|uniref:Tyrosine-type recombinase/integrase n=1 Tax=Nocardia albiluteola TaxID=2842303 RepID=A0ABS6BBG7_9NOCA|nr:tyrosine-type recombinase/integrase [Nocardia albiluteola]MBU3067614.1 tyrosine-type recombinase/integrase [Nocardia albiluteola]
MTPETGAAIRVWVSPALPPAAQGIDADSRFYAATEQIWQVYDAIDPQFRIAVVLGAFFGLRLSEIAGADIEDLNWSTLIYTPGLQYRKPSCREPDRLDAPDDSLKRPASTKPFPVDPWAADLLRQLLDGRTSGYMVIVNGERVASHQISRAIAAAVDKIGGPMAERVTLGRRYPERRFTSHGLRHYYASTLLAVGETIATVTMKVRHKSPVTTLKVYTHLVNAGKRLDADTLGAEAQRGRRAVAAAGWNTHAA